MVQHRTATALVAGAFTLLNGSAAVGLFSYGFSLFTLSDRQLVNAPLFHAVEIALALILHTFHVLMGSVFWKLRLMDQRADLLSSIQRSVTAVTALQLGMMAFNGFVNAFLWNKAPYFGLLFLPAVVALLLLWRFWSIDVLEERLRMLQASVLLQATALCVLFVDTAAKWNVRRELLDTRSPALMMKAMDDNDFSLLASLAVVVCLARVYGGWWFTSTSTSSLRGDQVVSSKQQEDEKHVQKQGQEQRQQEQEEDVDVLPRPTLETAHVWLLAAAFFSLLGPPVTPLLLSSAVLVGATIKPKVWDGKGDIFYKLGAGQRRIDNDY